MIYPLLRLLSPRARESHLPSYICSSYFDYISYSIISSGVFFLSLYLNLVYVCDLFGCPLFGRAMGSVFAFWAASG